LLVLLVACGGAPAQPIENSTQPKLQPKRPRVHKDHLQVLLVGAESTYLEGALLTMPNVTAAAMLANEYDPQHVPDVDVVIFNDFTPSSWPVTADLLLIHPSRAPIAVREEITNPHITRVAAGHPVIGYVELANVRIDRSRVFDIARGETALAATNSGEAIIAAKDDGGQRVIAIGFALEASDLPMLTAFPLLLGNAMTWFAN
jgi:hypothetical protein